MPTEKKSKKEDKSPLTISSTSDKLFDDQVKEEKKEKPSFPERSEAKRTSFSRASAKGEEEETKSLGPIKAKTLQGKDFGLDLEEMAKAGLHFGHKTSKVHPKMKPYLFGTRNTVHIIDLEKTVEKFIEALGFIQQLISENKVLLLVGTKVQAKNLVEVTAKKCSLPYISERWLGGTFTNFETIKKRIDYFRDLERKKAEGELEKYTKKERAEIDKELKDLEFKVGGIKNLTQLPSAIFVLDMKKDNLAIKEAIKKGVKVIALSDTNTDPTLADYPVPANDDAISSLKYILEKVEEVILSAKLKAKSEKQQPEV